MTKVGLGDGMSSAASQESLAGEAYEPVIGALSLLLRANEAAGTIRPGLDPDDVLLIMGFLWRIDPRSHWRSRSGRLLDILMDGLKAGAPGAAPPSPAGRPRSPPVPAAADPAAPPRRHAPGQLRPLPFLPVRRPPVLAGRRRPHQHRPARRIRQSHTEPRPRPCGPGDAHRDAGTHAEGHRGAADQDDQQAGADQAAPRPAVTAAGLDPGARRPGQ